MRTSRVCQMKIYVQRWTPLCLRAMTPRPAASPSSCTVWPATQSTRRFAEMRWWRPWMERTPLNGNGMQSLGLNVSTSCVPQPLFLFFFGIQGGSEQNSLHNNVHKRIATPLPSCARNIKETHQTHHLFWWKDLTSRYGIFGYDFIKKTKDFVKVN